MAVTLSTRDYTTDGYELFNNANENLIRGMPDEYTLKFYRAMSIMVKQETKIQLNESIITVRPEAGFSINPLIHSHIHTFKILTPNALVYFHGSW